MRERERHIGLTGRGLERQPLLLGWVSGASEVVGALPSQQFFRGERSDGVVHKQAGPVAGLSQKILKRSPRVSLLSNHF